MALVSRKDPLESSWMDAVVAFVCRDAYPGAACTVAANDAAEAAAEVASGADAVAGEERADEYTHIEVLHRTVPANLGMLEFAGVGYGYPYCCGSDQNYHADRLHHEILPEHHLLQSTP